MENKKTITQYKRCLLLSYEEPTMQQFIKLNCERFAYILHDRDFYTDEDLEKYLNNNEGIFPEWKPGDIKKPHYHIYIELKQKKTKSSICSTMNISEMFFQKVVDEIPVIRYFTHIDNPEKETYFKQDIISNFDVSYSFELNITDNDFITKVIQAINDEQIKGLKDLTQIAIEYNKLQLVMARCYFFNTLIKENKKGD